MTDALEPLRARFRARCREDLATLRSAMADFDGAIEAGIATTIHRMSGMAGSIGYAELSRLAGDVDECLARGEAPKRADVERLETELARVAALP